MKINVTLAYQPLPEGSSGNGIEIDFLRRLDSIEELNDIQKQWKAEIELGDYVKSIIEPILSALSPPIRKRCTLDKVLNPERVDLRLVTIEGHLQLIKHTSDRSRSFDLSFRTSPNITVPFYEPSQIEVLCKILPNRILKVRINQEIFCCKLAVLGFSNLIREVEVLDELNRVQLHPSSRVPRLRGLVGSSGSAIGLLMDYVDASEQAVPLGYFEKRIEEVTSTRRETWAKQIKDTLNDLHRNGIVWGDAKPNNILLDRNDNIWISDFGGSRTEGWVDVEHRETRQGDEQGLQRILSFLSV